MVRKTIIAAAAAAVLGAIGSLGTAAPAQAVPLTQTLAKPQVDLSTVTPAHSKKRRYRKRQYGGYRKRYRSRPSVSFSFGFAPGFYYGSSFHPQFRVYNRAPSHCHRWRDRYGHRHRTCHRHY